MAEGRERGSFHTAKPQDFCPLSSVFCLLILCDLALDEVGRLQEDELERLLAAAKSLNPELFVEAAGAGAAAGEEVITVAALEKAVALVIARGHANAWDYPWQVFKSAVETLEEDSG